MPNSKLPSIARNTYSLNALNSFNQNHLCYWHWYHENSMINVMQEGAYKSFKFYTHNYACSQTNLNQLQTHTIHCSNKSVYTHTQWEQSHLLQSSSHCQEPGIWGPGLIQNNTSQVHNLCTHSIAVNLKSDMFCKFKSSYLSICNTYVGPQASFSQAKALKIKKVPQILLMLLMICVNHL